MYRGILKYVGLSKNDTFVHEDILLMHYARGEGCMVHWCARNLRQMALVDVIWTLTAYRNSQDSLCVYADCTNSSNIYFLLLLLWWGIAVQVHVLRSTITDATSKSVLPSLTSELRPNCPATVPTPPVVADYNMKWSIVITWKYYSLPTGG